MAPDIERITALAVQGKTAKEIGVILGCGKNAVLGRTFRAGIKLGDLNGWADPATRQKKPPRPRKPRIPKTPGQKDPAHVAMGHMTNDRLARHGAKMGRGGGYPISFRIQAIAAALVCPGEHHRGQRAAAEAMGCSYPALRLWLRSPELVARATPIAEAARRLIAEQKASWEARQAALRQAETERLAEYNAPILAALRARCALICARYLAGETLEQIGVDLGVSRERIRQLMAPAIKAGLDTSGVDRANTVKAVWRAWLPTPKGPRIWSPEEREARRQRALAMHQSGVFAKGRRGGRPKGGKNKRPMNISDAERKRRSDAMKALWAVRSGATITGPDDATRSAPARSEGIDHA